MTFFFLLCKVPDAIVRNSCYPTRGTWSFHISSLQLLPKATAYLGQSVVQKSARFYHASQVIRRGYRIIFDCILRSIILHVSGIHCKHQNHFGLPYKQDTKVPFLQERTRDDTLSRGRRLAVRMYCKMHPSDAHLLRETTWPGAKMSRVCSCLRCWRAGKSVSIKPCCWSKLSSSFSRGSSECNLNVFKWTKFFNPAASHTASYNKTFTSEVQLA